MLVLEKVVIDPGHALEQNRVYNNALILLRQGQELADVVIYLRKAYRDLWIKWNKLKLQ